MKKLSIALAAILAVSMLAGCGNSNSGSTSTSASTSSSMSSSISASTSQADSDNSAVNTSTLDAIMDKMYTDVELPMMLKPMPAAEDSASEYTVLTADNAEYMTGVSADEFSAGIAADAAVTSIAHSVVLLQAKSADDAAALAESVAEKANPMKGLCVGAERVIVAYSGDVVLLVMSQNDFAQPLLNSFTAQMGEDKVTVVKNEEFAQEAPMDGEAAANDSSVVAVP